MDRLSLLRESRLSQVVRRVPISLYGRAFNEQLYAIKNSHSPITIPCSGGFLSLLLNREFRAQSAAFSRFYVTLRSISRVSVYFP